MSVLKSNIETTEKSSQTPQNQEEGGSSTPEQIEAKRNFWDRIPKYRWWVSPLNFLFISLFLITIDVLTKPNTSLLNIDWAWWPIGGLFFAYAVSFLLIKRPEIAWVIGPLLMLGTSILLLAIDLVFPPNSGLLYVDWAAIPIAAVLTFGVIIPIVTKAGRKRSKPIEKFRKALDELDEQEKTDAKNNIPHTQKTD